MFVWDPIYGENLFINQTHFLFATSTYISSLTTQFLNTRVSNETSGMPNIGSHEENTCFSINFLHFLDPTTGDDTKMMNQI